MFDLVWRGDESIHKRNVIGEGFRLSVVIQQTQGQRASDRIRPS
jgi:hypothetical protein